MLAPLTLEDAKQLKRGDFLYSTNQNGADNQPLRWKVNGKVQLWVRDPGRIRVPLKHGLYAYDAITEGDFDAEGVCRNLAVEIPD